MRQSQGFPKEIRTASELSFCALVKAVLTKVILYVKLGTCGTFLEAKQSHRNRDA